MNHFLLFGITLIVTVQSYYGTNCTITADCQYYDSDLFCDNATCTYKNCINTANYCDVGGICNVTTVQCDYTNCVDDSECTNPINPICSWWNMVCVPRCTTQGPTWCADAFFYETLACNTTSDECDYINCNDTSDCTSPYVCDYGTCFRGCDNDAFCLDLNNDPSYKCQSSGYCERDQCMSTDNCTDIGYVCDTMSYGNGECIEGCHSNDTVCQLMQSYIGDSQWQCGTDDLCIYRDCYNDTECSVRYNSTEYVCDSSGGLHWSCEWRDPTYCEISADCDALSVCEYMQCIPGCTTQNDTYCENRFGYSRSYCNTTTMECDYANCDNTPDYCERDYGVGYMCQYGAGTSWCDRQHCDDDSACSNPSNPICNGGSCGPTCIGEDPQWCSDQYSDDDLCIAGRCGRQMCNDTSICPSGFVCEYGSCSRGCFSTGDCTESGYVCDANVPYKGNCIEGCIGKNITWCPWNNGDSYECGSSGYCVYRECHNDTDCHIYLSSDYRCDMEDESDWHCTTGCDTSSDCNATSVCEYMNCISGCTSMDSTYCANRFGEHRSYCNATTMECDYSNCVNTPDYCERDGVGYYCDDMTVSCERDYCDDIDDAQCSHFPICHQGYCGPSCVGQGSTWCADDYNEYYSCNENTGRCEQRMCNDTSTCDTGYVCYGESCVRGCHNSSDCTESGYVCDAISGDKGECVEGCFNDTECYTRYWNTNYECEEYGYCVYRDCHNDTECENRYSDDGGYYVCDMSQHNHWSCQWRSDDYCETSVDCNSTSVCEYMSCIPGCTSNDDCENRFDYERSYCNVTTMECEDANCVNTPDYCQRYTDGIGYFCNEGYCDSIYCYDDDDSLCSSYPEYPICHGDFCGPSCIGETWCEDASYYEYYSCATGRCQRQICNDTSTCPDGYVCDYGSCVEGCFDSSTCIESGYVCDAMTGDKGDCVEGCINDTECHTRYSSNYDCGEYGYCVYRDCRNDTDCENRDGDDEYMGGYYVCDMSQHDHWSCQWRNPNYCDTSEDCNSTSVCEYMSCIQGCTSNDDCANRFGYERSYCDVTSMECLDSNCVNTPDYCQFYDGIGYFCDGSGYCVQEFCFDNCTNPENPICHAGICGPSCSDQDTSWCSYHFGEQYVCNTNGECERESCTDNTWCETRYNDLSYKCDSDGYCRRERCWSSANCTEYGYVCNIEDEFEGGECVEGCNSDDTWCHTRYGDDYQCNVFDVCQPVAVLRTTETVVDDGTTTEEAAATTEDATTEDATTTTEEATTTEEKTTEEATTTEEQSTTSDIEGVNEEETAAEIYSVFGTMGVIFVMFWWM